MHKLDLSPSRNRERYLCREKYECRTTFGIIFSLVVVGIASMNLMLDFDMIERGSEMGAPKYMEWYGAFGLMVTIVWLYLEILRLLSKISRR